MMFLCRISAQTHEGGRIFLLLTKAQEIVGKLGAASDKRYKSYLKNISSFEDGEVFDDRIRDLMFDISKDEGELVKEVNNFLDSIHWNQSTKDPIKLHAGVEKFAASHVSNRAWRRKFKLVKSRLEQEVKKWALKTVKYNSIQDILDAIPRLDTHAGWSFIVTGLRSKGDYMDSILDAFNYEVKQAKACKSFNKPILLGLRTQSSVPVDTKTGEFDLDGRDPNDFKKTRLVSMVDIHVIIAELIFAKPFQSKLCMTNWYVGGKDNSRIRNGIMEARRHFRHWTSIDYSSFDQTIPGWLIREAYDIVRAAFSDSDFDNELFEILREDFIHKVFVTKEGLIDAHDGIPSGSMFTQIIGSICNKLMIDTYMVTRGLIPRNYEMFIMGDDNLIFTDNIIDLKDMENYLKYEFGTIMNHMKADAGNREDDPIFLSRFWTPFGEYRHPRILIAKLLFPERRRLYDKRDFTPAMVLQAYFDTFPLGMEEIFDINKLNNIVAGYIKTHSTGEFLTGSDRYRKLYLSV